jgi:molybdopterin-synthase adenylyltransferase
LNQKIFDYQTAFSRNIGWVTRQEQDVLKSKRIAIAGLGGVGGSHLLTLVRLGVCKFNISDFDLFEHPNFNRQAGASQSHLNQPKVDVLAEMALDINPTLEINKFPEGVNAGNMSAFLTDVDIYVDGLDFFAFNAREALFSSCAEYGIPAITAAPMGMGAALLNFIPGHMTFEEYFQLKGKPDADKIISFLIGLSPAMLQRGYLVDSTTVDLLNHKGPSTSMACEICAGFAATQALKILLKRGDVLAAPWGLQIDAYQNKLAKTWRPWGNRNLLQRLAISFARKQFMSNIKIEG